ncbi:MAG: hypothetical protein AAF990_01130 [Bacteroidota bacterium]
MKKAYIAILIFTICACSGERALPGKQQPDQGPPSPVTEAYELIQSTGKEKGLLVLFGGFPETPEDVKREFDILDMAQKNDISILLMRFNKRLWLEASEKQALKTILEEAVERHQLSKDNLFIGGFSSGGNISLLLSSYLHAQQSSLQPKGIFIVDSPVDLLQLYRCSQRNIERKFSAISMKESQRTVNSFDEYFGPAAKGIKKYEEYSPYISQTENIRNLASLKDTKIRLYTEPDTTWWKVNRQNEYEDLNACYIKKLAQQLQKQLGNQQVELIETEGKGYRANGYRHPHSWSIVDKKDLFDWMLNR